MPENGTPPAEGLVIPPAWAGKRNDCAVCGAPVLRWASGLPTPGTPVHMSCLVSQFNDHQEHGPELARSVLQAVKAMQRSSADSQATDGLARAALQYGLLAVKEVGGG